MNPLIRLIPPFFVRLFASPYVAGDSIERAVDVAADLWGKRGLTTTLDLLAENIDNAELVEQNVQTYLTLIDQVASDSRFGGGLHDPTLSLKLSSYTTDPLERGGDAAGSREGVRRIVEHAREKGVRLTLDMESREWTDFTLDYFDALHQDGHDHIGCVLQTRLTRTRADLDRLPKGCRVRLVIGIYQEPEEVATTDKAEMKDRLLEHAKILLERGHYVEFATHDERYITRFLDDVVPATGAPKDRFEVQFLYGVPRSKLQKRLTDDGINVRLYTPFALGWPMAIAYLRRRLDEYPQMMFLVARNMLKRG